MTVAEAARELGLTERAVQRRIKLGQMRAQKFSRDWMVPVEEVAVWKARGRLKPGPKPKAEA